MEYETIIQFMILCDFAMPYILFVDKAYRRHRMEQRCVVIKQQAESEKKTFAKQAYKLE